MESINLLEIASVAAAIATIAVAGGSLLYQLIHRSGPGAFMWHD